LADADFCREVNHRIDAGEGTHHNVAIANIAANEFGLARKIGRSFAIAMDLLDEAVENPHPMATSEQSAGDRATDETGTTCDEDEFIHLAPPCLYFKS
jgi:hypothetical protein